MEAKTTRIYASLSMLSLSVLQSVSTMKQVVTFLLALACVSLYFGEIQSECCRAKLKLYYTIKDGTCADVGGRLRTRGTGCQITICADGKVLQYYYCGKGSCNALGCDCDDGCRTGEWKQSFLTNYHQKVINVTDEIW